MSTPALVMTEGPLVGQRFAVNAELFVGRVDADVTIEDPLISRRHAVLRPAGDAVEIEDLGSLNGTWVNGMRVEAVRRLQHGDLVQLGGASFEIADYADGGATKLAPNPSLAPTSVSRRPAPREPARVEDELRPVTALFADIVGSTALGERLPPDQVKLVVGEFVSRMTRSVEQYGGLVQAYMGDGIAAFFGIPRAHEDDPERAARAALAILAETQQYARELEAAWEIFAFDVRVGVNTGAAAVGVVGAADPQAVSLGDTTNVAARLQAAAGPGSIVVGEATAKALVRTFALEPLGEVTVKGRSQPVAAWRLVGVQPTVEARDATPLIGRDEDLGHLRSILDEVASGRGHVVVLFGDAGLGKTRLLAEQRRLAAERITWLEGHCLSYGTELVYGPFIQILRNWVGIEEGEAELSARTKLRAKLGLFPSSQIPSVMPYLARLLSLRLDATDEARLAVPPAELAREIRRAYVTWIATLARRGPVAVAVEDVHWIDSPSRALVEELLDLTDRAPLLLVTTLRIDPDSEGWALRMRALIDHAHRTTELRLAPLPEPDARRLLEALPHRRELAGDELDLILAGAEGNPLYLEELVNAFTDTSGARQSHTWAPTVTGPKVLTPTLESLLLARVDELPDGCRRLAQLAAVIGRSFPLRVLEHIAENDDIEHDVTAVVRADVIHELRRYPEVEYVFRHGLLWRACLSTVPPGRRRELHQAVAVAFETLFDQSLDDYLEVIAHHYAKSTDLHKALDYLERAGERAAALAASGRAVELWGQALKVAEKIGDVAAVERVRARLAAGVT